MIKDEAAGDDFWVGPPVPPALTWEELESGQSGQLPLPGLAELPTEEERIFLAVARAWATQFAELPENGPPPRRVDQLALAALAIVCATKTPFTSVAQQQIETNIELAQRRSSLSWLDRLPWSVALAGREVSPPNSWRIEELVANLNHHNSTIRMWMMEIAWIVRSWLPLEKATPILLENVAGTLLGVEMAWGLAASLHDDPKAFLQIAQKWSPDGNFTEQYASRVQALKDETFASQACYWKLEADIFRQLFLFKTLSGDSGASSTR